MWSAPAGGKACKKPSLIRACGSEGWCVNSCGGLLRGAVCVLAPGGFLITGVSIPPGETSQVSQLLLPVPYCHSCVSEGRQTRAWAANVFRPAISPKTGPLRHGPFPCLYGL